MASTALVYALMQLRAAVPALEMHVQMAKSARYFEVGVWLHFLHVSEEKLPCRRGDWIIAHCRRVVYLWAATQATSDMVGRGFMDLVRLFTGLLSPRNMPSVSVLTLHRTFSPASL